MTPRSDRDRSGDLSVEAHEYVEHRPGNLVRREEAIRQREPGTKPRSTPLQLNDGLHELALEAGLLERPTQEALGLGG